MSKSISGALLGHIQGSETTITVCVKITRKDGVIVGFTSHTEDLTVSGQLYNADIGGVCSHAFTKVQGRQAPRAIRARRAAPASLAMIVLVHNI